MKKRIQILIIVILYALMFVPLSAQTPHTISGIVKDRASVPISGVNIRVEGQKWKASTGKEGKFTLEIPQNSTITFSSVGYEPVTIHSGEKKWIEITLKESQSLLPEITVTSTLKNSMKFVFAPSDLELIKDMLYLKTRYKIPSKRFQSDSRVCQTTAGELKKTFLPLCTMARIMIFYSGEETSAATGLKKNIIHALHRS